jgi:hypothetical protein
MRGFLPSHRHGPHTEILTVPVPATAWHRLSRQRGEGLAALRLGLRCLWQRRGARLGEGAPDPPQPRRPGRSRLLSHPCSPRHGPCRARAGSRQPLDDRGLLRGGQGRGRPRPVRGPLPAMASWPSPLRGWIGRLLRPMDRLVPPHHARHAGPRRPRRPAQDRRRATSPISTWRPSCCPSPSPSCAACSGASSGRTGPISRPS